MIAILGYGTNCSEFNLEIAHQVGSILGKHQQTIVCGGTQGTFEAAFRANRENGGMNAAFLERNRTVYNPELIDSITYIENTPQKHLKLAKEAIFAIIIGGGPGSQKIIEKLNALQKLMLAVEGTGGVTEENNDWFKRINPNELESKIVEQLQAHALM